MYMYILVVPCRLIEKHGAHWEDSTRLECLRAEAVGAADKAKVALAVLEVQLQLHHWGKMSPEFQGRDRKQLRRQWNKQRQPDINEEDVLPNSRVPISLAASWTYRCPNILSTHNTHEYQLGLLSAGPAGAPTFFSTPNTREY